MRASRLKASAESQLLRTVKDDDFAPSLLAWYDQHARKLPWREDREPYRVWVSEIMLQQTRVAAVVEHYRRFLKKFPTVRKLASARESSVLAAWSGLGYYRRARMLHAAAKLVANEYQGKFPSNCEGLRQLPSIGRYTAAAIASIAYDEPVAVVDGNVERVLERMSGTRLTREQTWNTATKLLHLGRPGDFNQAMMELGATICLPGQPQCLLCPVSRFCAARGALPTKPTKPRQRKRKIYFGLARRDGHVLLVQRDKKESLMPGMWELPEISHPVRARRLFSLRHSITVTDYQVEVMKLCTPEEGTGNWMALSRIASLPLTGLARKILQRAELL